MNRFKTAAITILFAAMATQARAEAIIIDLSKPTFTPGDVTLVGTNPTNRNLSIDAIEDYWNVEIGNLLYKSEVDSGSEYGAAAPYYKTTYSNTPSDPADALITWQGPSIIACPTCYLLVKGGSPTTASQYLFNLGSWNGQDSISLLGFWPQQGAVSNIVLFGPAVVPEPATLTLMLLGLGGVAASRYRNRRRS